MQSRGDGAINWGITGAAVPERADDIVGGEVVLEN
jgi:hypothetical protein